MKVKMSECLEDRGFECVICGERYWLSSRTYEGIICCICHTYIHYPETITRDINLRIKYFLRHPYYISLYIIIGYERRINWIRGYLYHVSKEEKNDVNDT